jgi:class 3 adenylate cyclase
MSEKESVENPEEKVEELRSELERERDAREQAEQLAEQKTRSLYDTRNRISLQQTISRVANETDDVEDAMTSAMEKIVDHFQWSVGHVVNRSQEFEFQSRTGILYNPSEENLPTEDEDLGSTHELHNRVENSESLEIIDLNREDLPDSLLPYAESGYQSAIGFPIIVHQNVEAIMEFFATKPVKETDEIREIATYTGRQLGRVLERKKAEKLEEAFEHYVPHSVMERALEDSNTLELGGQNKEISVLYADLARFTDFSAGREASDVAYVLNEVLTLMTQCVFEHGGILDKYVGDAIVAEFGILPDYEPENKTLRACRAALGMKQKMDELHEDWSEAEKRQLNLRIGINTGEAAVGNMGSEMLFDFTGVGETMNFGSQLEQANKVFGTSCLVDRQTYRAVDDAILTRNIGWVQPKHGRDDEPVYELVDLRESADEELNELCGQFERGLLHFKNRRWDEAYEVFQSLNEKYPADPPTQFYMKKSRHYRQDPPEDDWSPAQGLT